MTEQDRLGSAQHATHKEGHSSGVHINSHAVLVDVLKTLELQLQKREMVPSSPEHSFNPVWFLAETERNIFLWRHGRSLIEADEFEFWIDVEALIDKRLKQLAAPDSNNPFINPLWGTSFSDQDSARAETEYLEALRAALGMIQNHAHALSRVASILAREAAGACVKKAVMLPVTAPDR